MRVAVGPRVSLDTAMTISTKNPLRVEVHEIDGKVSMSVKATALASVENGTSASSHDLYIESPGVKHVKSELSERLKKSEKGRDGDIVDLATETQVPGFSLKRSTAPPKLLHRYDRLEATKLASDWWRQSVVHHQQKLAGGAVGDNWSSKPRSTTYNLADITAGGWESIGDAVGLYLASETLTGLKDRQRSRWAAGKHADTINQATTIHPRLGDLCRALVRQAESTLHDWSGANRHLELSLADSSLAVLTNGDIRDMIGRIRQKVQTEQDLWSAWKRELFTETLARDAQDGLIQDTWLRDLPFKRIEDFLEQVRGLREGDAATLARTETLRQRLQAGGSLEDAFVYVLTRGALEENETRAGLKGGISTKKKKKPGKTNRRKKPVKVWIDDLNSTNEVVLCAPDGASVAGDVSVSQPVVSDPAEEIDIPKALHAKHADDPDRGDWQVVAIRTSRGLSPDTVIPTSSNKTVISKTACNSYTVDDSTVKPDGSDSETSSHLRCRIDIESTDWGDRPAASTPDTQSPVHGDRWDEDCPTGEFKLLRRWPALIKPDSEVSSNVTQASDASCTGATLREDARALKYNDAVYAVIPTAGAGAIDATDASIRQEEVARGWDQPKAENRRGRRTWSMGRLQGFVLDTAVQSRTRTQSLGPDMSNVDFNQDDLYGDERNPDGMDDEGEDQDGMYQ